MYLTKISYSKKKKKKKKTVQNLYRSMSKTHTKVSAKTCGKLPKENRTVLGKLLVLVNSYHCTYASIFRDEVATIFRRNSYHLFV